MLKVKAESGKGVHGVSIYLMQQKRVHALNIEPIKCVGGRGNMEWE